MASADEAGDGGSGTSGGAGTSGSAGDGTGVGGDNHGNAGNGTGGEAGSTAIAGGGGGGSGGGDPVDDPRAAPYRVVLWGDLDAVEEMRVEVVDSEGGTPRSAALGAEVYDEVAVDAEATQLATGTGYGGMSPNVLLYDVDNLDAPVMIESDPDAAAFSAPSFSLDGELLAYVRKSYDATMVPDELHVVTLSAIADGPSTLTLPMGGVTGADPVWSPGGALALLLDFSDGSGGAWIATSSASADAWTLQEVGAPCDPSQDIAWDGDERLYCTGYPTPDAPTKRLYRFDPASGGTADEIDLGDVLDPARIAISPDRAQLAFEGQDASGNEDAFVLDLASGEVEKLTDLDSSIGGEVHAIAWRPDSKVVVVAAQWEDATLPAVSGSLLEITLSGATRRVDGPALAYQVGLDDLRYTPDGRALLLTSDALHESDDELFALGSFALQAPNPMDLLLRGVVMGGDVDGFGVSALP